MAGCISLFFCSFERASHHFIAPHHQDLFLPPRNRPTFSGLPGLWHSTFPTDPAQTCRKRSPH